MGNARGELPYKGHPLRFLQLLLQFHSLCKLFHHLVVAPDQDTDLVLSPAAPDSDKLPLCNLFACVGDLLNGLRIFLRNEKAEDYADTENK
ncbi:MAG: hypothetical protein A4E62_02732 [Syntrophorhabdus sp. PtaU1.Bin002]|nr:MAG: hypothetical protein A4E62_02732 [Syntrophorhabdus sp. PtaU1.Bin002]